jgi:hypothetical protein
LLADATLSVGGEPSPPTDHIRTSEPVIASLLKYGYGASATFRLLVDALNRSNLLVYVDLRKDGTGTGLHRLAASNGVRFAWISIARDRGQEQLTARLAHELQHAVEIATVPEVVNDGTLAAYYRRRGFSQGGGTTAETFESPAAQTIERTVFRELVRPR